MTELVTLEIKHFYQFEEQNSYSCQQLLIVWGSLREQYLFNEEK